VQTLCVALQQLLVEVFAGVLLDVAEVEVFDFLENPVANDLLEHKFDVVALDQQGRAEYVAHLLLDLFDNKVFVLIFVQLGAVVLEEGLQHVEFVDDHFVRVVQGGLIFLVDGVADDDGLYVFELPEEVLDGHFRLGQCSLGSLHSFVHACAPVEGLDRAVHLLPERIQKRTLELFG